MATTFSSIASKLAGLPSLERVIEDDPDQLQFWYGQLVELELPDQIEGENGSVAAFSRDDVEIVLQSMRLIMQYEHTNAEELKEVAEREAVEMAEKEENWEMERDMMKEEISGLRERITSRAGIDETNEAFRAEIDSLTSENAYLKQLGRDRDRELADQRDKAEELSSRVESLEKERGLFINNQAQLEDTIREMNRRISSKSDVSQRTDWESRKLRQRNEQAVLLSDQLQNVISQNDQLKAEVDRLTEALENATALIQDSASKYADFGEQLGFAEKSIDRLLTDNRELKQQLNEKESLLSQTTENVHLSSQEFNNVLQAKNAQIDQLREGSQRNEFEIEELRARLEMQRNEEREEELERLRSELIAATETARKLFGAAILMDEADSTAARMAADPIAELRLRIVQMDKELEIGEKEIKSLKEEKAELEGALEQKDLANARVNAQNQRFRQLAFGDADGEIRRLEKQLEFRDQQLEKLTHKCTLLQVELQQYIEQKMDQVGKKELDEGKLQTLPVRTPKVALKKQRPVVDAKPSRITLEQEPVMPEITEEEEEQEQNEDGEEVPVVEEPEGHQVELPKKRTYFVKPQVCEEVEANAAVIKSLYQEIVRLIQDLEIKQKELDAQGKICSEREALLTSAKRETSAAQKELGDLRELVFGKGGGEVQDESALESKNAALEIENMELRRFVDTVQNNGGSELERRMAEGTRRLIFLAIQNAKLERRAETDQRLRRAIAEENGKLSERFQRLSIGDQRRSWQLMMENDINLIEVARLQNALLHSVPLVEYNRLLKDFKHLLHGQTVGTNDAGYQSAEDESSQAYQFNISRGSILLAEERSSDEVLVKNRRLQEMNDVLEAQNDFWKRECQKHKTQIEELSAFMSDLENETEMKSMIANIERRFLQALREQFDSIQEQMISERQLTNLEKQLHRRKREWRLERQHLVHVIGNLNTVLRNLRRNATFPITMEQLIAFKKSMESLKEKEKLVERKSVEVEKSTAELQAKFALAESSRISIEDIIANDYQLQYMQTTLQGYQMNVLTLSSEVKKVRDELQKTAKELVERNEQVDQLTEQIQSCKLLNTDLSWMMHMHREDEMMDKERMGPVKEALYDVAAKEDSSDSSLADEFFEEDKRTRKRKSFEAEVQSQGAVMIFDNSKEYECQIKTIKEAARLCVQNYQEQLEQKQHAIQEYKSLIEGLRIATALSRTSDEDSGYKSQELKSSRGDEERLKSSAELINNLQLEEKERQVLALEQQVRELEEANAELGEQLSLLIRRSLGRDFGVQVNLSGASFPSHGLPKSLELPKNVEETARSGDVASVVESSASDSNRDDEEEASDSGTVEDIEEKKPKSRRSSSNSTGSVDRKSSGATQTLRPATFTGLLRADAYGDSGVVDAETLLLRHRNETRRLRMRIVALERRNKQLMDENTSLRERTRFSGSRKPMDPSSETGLLKKDNERILRENKNLAKSLQQQKDELDAVQKRLKKSEAAIQSKITSESWEERKRHGQALVTLRRQINELEVREKDLNERINRRDKLIEQLNKDQGSRYVDTDRLNNVLKEWRQEKLAFEKRENELKVEGEVWMERHRSGNLRLEMLGKENKALQQRISGLQEKLRKAEAQKNLSPFVKNKEVQTPDEFNFSWQELEVEKERLGLKLKAPSEVISTLPVAPLPKALERQSTYTREWTHSQPRNEHKEDRALNKQIRRAELLQLETTGQLNTLKMAYDELLRNYNNLLRLNDQHRLRRVNDEEEIAALVVMKDKLMAKDNEIQLQRHKIVELERRLWNWEIG